MNKALLIKENRALREQISVLEKSQLRNISDLEKSYKEQIANLEKAYQDSLTNLEKAYQEGLTDLEEKYKAIISNLQLDISHLKLQVKALKKMVFGAHSEKSKAPPESAPGQLSLFEGEGAAVVEEEQMQEVKPHQRRKAKAHPGRNALPEHLPEEVQVIEPEEDTTDMVKIGEERTEYIEYNPASLVRKVIIRPKYARPKGQGIVIAPLPARPLEKSIAGAGLLAHVEVSKFLYHNPFYRQIQQFRRQYNWTLSAATLNDWHRGVCQLLQPLYDCLWRRVLARGYVQVDESPIKVMDCETKGKTHQGYQWVYHSPEQRLVCFQYRKGRGMHGPQEVLKDYQGYVQCDGYGVYDQLGRKNSALQLAGCWTHARRKFHDALESDPSVVQIALKFWSQLYRAEDACRHLAADDRLQYRLQHHLPIVKELCQWAKLHTGTTPPKSPLGKALYYLNHQWPKLKIVFDDGRLELDNNLIENKIRPLALGRKNYLFAGSPAGAQRIAMMYSFFGSCLANDVEPYAWLKDVLERIPIHPINKLEELLPSEWRAIPLPAAQP